ncbi:MAG TPA: hypothetical protein VI362_01130 [Ignavibacteriaceae bacterium]|nr:hypothetical protein [Ignavibacteriaceae bacterium]
MKNLISKSIIIISFVSVNLYGQFYPGAKQISLSHSDVALANDVFALFSNPAGLSQINWREVGIYYSPAPFGLSELANGYAAYLEPFEFGSVAIGGMSYGYELYREAKVTAGYSFNYNNIFFIGLSANYHSFSIQDYGSTGVLYFNLGGLAYITNDLRWGFAVDNLNRASLADADDQIPMIFNTGFSYNVINSLSFNLALEKDIRYNPSIKVGIDYDIIEYLSLRLGTANEPAKFSFGIGINYSMFNLDYALFTHPDLGLTHQAGIILSFGKTGSRYQSVRENLGKKD